MRNKILSIVKYVIFLGLSIGLLFYALKDISFEQFLIELSRTDYKWIILSLAVAVFSHYLRAYRWVILMEPMGYKPKIVDTFNAVMIGYFANLAFPRAGEVTRCAMLKKTDNIPVDSSFGTVITERIFDLIVLLGLIFFNVVIEKQLKSFLWDEFGEKLSPIFENYLIVGSVGFVMLAVATALYLKREQLYKIGFVKKIRTVLGGLINGVMSFRKIRKKIQFLVSTFMIWFCYWLMLQIAVLAYPETAHFGFVETFTLLIVGGLGMSAPVQGGIGAYHLLVGNLLIIYGLSGENGIALATILHSSQMLMMIVVGSISLIFVLIKESNLKKITNANSQ